MYARLARIHYLFLGGQWKFFHLNERCDTDHPIENYDEHGATFISLISISYSSFSHPLTLSCSNKPLERYEKSMCAYRPFLYALQLHFHYNMHGCGWSEIELNWMAYTLSNEIILNQLLNWVKSHFIAFSFAFAASGLASFVVIHIFSSVSQSYQEKWKYLHK